MVAAVKEAANERFVQGAGMKPQIAYGVAATRDAVGKVFGPKTGAAFIGNPAVDAYAAALRFSDSKVISSGELIRALRRLAIPSGPFLLIARDLTIEARQVAASAGCDVVTEREFGWTDASYRRIRQNGSD